MDWFRLYHNIVDDPKILRLTAENRWYFVGFLSLSSREKVRGSLPPIEDIAISLRVKISKARALVDQFKACGLIDEDVGTKQLTMHGWAARQCKSDDVATRVKRFRERGSNVTNQFQQASRNVTNLLPRTCVTDTDTETDKEIPPTPSSGAACENEIVEPFQPEPQASKSKADPRSERIIATAGERWGASGVDAAADLLGIHRPDVIEYAATATFDKFGRKLTPGATAYWRRICQNHRDGPPEEASPRAPGKPAAPIEYAVCPNPTSLYPQPKRGNASA